MARRNLHRRSPSRVKRHGPILEGKSRILILSEGKRTETNYFGGLKAEKDLKSVVVRPLHGQPGPLGLYRRAVEEITRDPGIDEVYCVVDQDERHRAVTQLERRLKELDGRFEGTDVNIALSVPCFEFWLLLHFEFTDRPFLAAGKGRTACDSVISELRRHLPDYRKNAPRIFDQFEDRLETALANERKLRSVYSDSGPGLPRTNVGQLVSRLLEIADK